MTQSSSLTNATKANSTISSSEILVVSRFFPPKEGGIEEYSYNRCLQDPSRIIVMAASYPDAERFDREQPFPIHRWSIPEILPSTILGKLLKQVFHMVWAFVFAIRLYSRYRYRYIEWCHGYDFLPLLLLSYLLPINFFIHLHGNDILCPLRNPIIQILFEWTLQRAKGVVCNSAFTRDYLKSHFNFNTDTFVINPTVRPEKFGFEKAEEFDLNLGLQIREEYKIPKTSIVILSVGRLVRRKGFDRVIKNLPLLLDRGVDVHYLICGRGSIESELKLLASDLDVEDRVHFAGFVANEKLASYYLACDLFAMVTFFDANSASIEGFGIVYLEAGYFAKPVLASRVGGVSDAVQHEETGLLINPDSDQDISEALFRLCTDSEMRKRFGQKGKKLASRKTSFQALYYSS